MKPLFYRTGNHHLFLILKTAAGQEWIALLGKRKPNFPFWGDRFENATFYNVTQDRLFHATAHELLSLHFEKGPVWKISGREPFSFSIDLEPNYKRTKRILAMARFRYHLPSLSFQNGKVDSYGQSRGNLSSEQGEREGEAPTALPLEGATQAPIIENDPIVSGHGFSEQGKMIFFTLKDMEVPFQYDLWLESQGGGGCLNWQGHPTQFKSLFQKQLKDDWRWGCGKDFIPKNTKVLAVTHIPLKNWGLRREIVVCHTGGNQKWFGLRESFHV